MNFIYEGVYVEISETIDGWGGAFEIDDTVIVSLKHTFVGPDTVTILLKQLIDTLRHEYNFS
mgnify:CR=1 FL=1